jgi:hypothetical protein
MMLICEWSTCRRRARWVAIYPDNGKRLFCEAHKRLLEVENEKHAQSERITFTCKEAIPVDVDPSGVEERNHTSMRREAAKDGRAA